MPLSLDLSIDQFSLSLTKFAENGYERSPVSAGNVEYSLNGSSLETGELFEPKLVWVISAFVTAEQWRQLCAIYQRSERKRRTQQSYSIQVFDFVENYVEDSLTPTRAIVPGGTTTIEGGLISYPARFGARMFEPKAEKLKNSQYPYLARFTLKELDRVAP